MHQYLRPAKPLNTKLKINPARVEQHLLNLVLVHFAGLPMQGFLMKIKRAKYLYDGVTDKDYVKALALFCFLKENFPSSAIPDYTRDKIRKITGLHSNTIKKRIALLLKLGYVQFKTSKDGAIILKLNKVASKHKERNIDLSNLVYDSVKSVEKSLYAIYIGIIIERKKYAKQVIYEAHNSYDLNKLKSAKKREAQLKGVRGSKPAFVDNGISYKGLAKRLKVSLQKAFSIVSFATEFDFVVKIKRQYQLFCRDAMNRFEFCKNDVMKFMFCTKNNLYLILANRYRMGGRLTTTW